MNPVTIIFTILFTLVPIFELRGALPYAYFNDIPLWTSYAITVAVNALIAPLLFFFLNYLHKIFYRWSLYKRIFDSSVIRARKRIEPKIDKYGYLGLALFVAIPLPITGAYTGALGAWILGLDRKKSIAFIAIGVCISGLIVSLILLAGEGTHSIFIKNISR